MEEAIQNFGSKLKDYFDEKQYKEAEKFLDSIENLLENENISETTKDYIATKIFQSDYNIFSFINDVIPRKNELGSDWGALIICSLNFIKNIVSKFPNNTKNQHELIIRQCTIIIRSSVSAFEKEKAISIVCIILKQHNELISNDEIEDVYKKMFQFIITSDSKTSKVLLKNIFIILGVIARYYPNIITEINNTQMNSNKLAIHFIRNISSVTPGDKGSTSIYYGAFEGLSNLFCNFADIFDERILGYLYMVTKKVTDDKWIKDKHRNDDCRAAITFISKHSFIWSKCLVKRPDDFNWWHRTLKNWYHSGNADNRKAGLLALMAFYKEIAKIFEEKQDDVYNNIFKMFVKNFEQNLQKTITCSEENENTKLSLHGIAMFAKACKAQNQFRDFDIIFGSIVTILSNTYLSEEKISDEKLEYLPDYIKCCSTLLQEIEVTSEQIVLLQRVSVLMVKSFPKISKIYHELIIESVILCFVNIYNCDKELFEVYVQRFVCEAIIWSCNENPIENINETDEITYQNYLPIWKNMIDINNIIYDNQNVDTKKYIVTSIFDEIIKRLLISTSKLNLKIKIDLTKSESMTPENPNDYIIFINMVDLYNDILSSCNYSLFRKWIKRVSKHIIEKSLNNPVVSGYYKLMAEILKICEKIKYFDDIEQKEDKLLCFQMINNFLEGIISKIQHNKGETQISCLKLLFAAPVCFINNYLDILTPVFQVSFSLGLSYLKIANLAIETLNRWYQNFDISQIKPLIISILPYLDPYLRNKVYTGDPDIKSSYSKPKKYKKGKTKTQIDTESELLKLQKKIIVFVGQLDPELSLKMLKNDQNIETVPWNDKPSLKFAIPFADINSDVYLDKIIPRIIELAVFSGDRKTRAVSCEVLHGVMTVLLGTVREMSSEKSKDMFERLFRMIIGPVIQLGCDSDEVIRQIFEEFNLQLVHWFTSRNKLTSFESEILIETLMDFISHPTNTNLREYSGKCINEYVKWSIKQYKTEEVIEINQNIKKIIRKICWFCKHPNPDKKFGAALAFNSLYKTLREEESMINIFLIQLFYHFVENLTIDINRVNKERNNLEISLALNHIERIFHQKKELFNSYSSYREIPENIGGPLLKDIVYWILKKSGTNNIVCRNKCIELFFNLVPSVNGCFTVNDFINKYVDTSDWYIEIYEKNGIGEYCILQDFNKKNIYKFLQDLLRCLDGYFWIIKENIINLDGLKMKNLKMAVAFFLHQIAKKPFKDFNIENLCSSDIEDFNILQCEIINKLFELTILLVKLKNYSFLNSDFWLIITLYIFKPQELGFNILNNLETTKLHDNLLNMLNNLNNLPENHNNNLIETIYKYFDFNMLDISQNLLKENIALTQRQLLKGLLILQNSNFKNKIVLIPKYFSNSMQTIFEKLIDNNTTVYLPSSVLEYTEILLKLALLIKDPLPTLWNFITNNTKLSHHENFTNIKHGEYFYHTYKNIILDYLSQNMSNLMCYYFKIPTKPSLTNGGNILLDILKFTSDNRKNLNFSVKDIFKYCQNYFVFDDNMSFIDRKFQVEFLMNLAKLIVNKSEYKDIFKDISNWYILTLLFENINTRSMLEFKLKLLRLLPYFTGPEDDINIPLKSTLSQYITQIDKYIQENENNDNANCLIFNEWLKILCISKSRIVLVCVAEIYMKIINKELIPNFEDKLQIYFNKLDIDNQFKSLNIIYALSLTNEYISRYNLANEFLSSMLKTCSYDSFEHFYLCNIIKMVENIKLTTTKNNIVNKSINLILLENLFARIDLTKLENGNCPINNEILNYNNQGLIKEIFSLLKNVRKDNFVPEITEKESYRIYHCNSLNAFISLISNTNKDLKIYTYLFNENKSKNEFIWERIINCDVNYNFCIDFDKYPKFKKTFVNIRNENKNSAPQYIQTQNIFESSLSEDICQYDFSKSSLRNINSNNETKNQSYSQIIFQSVDLNKHECIASICGLIQHMVANEISPLQPENLPDWLKIIRDIMLDENTQKNIKLFFGRIIHNNDKIFEVYSKYFIVPIIKLIIECSDINYFVSDLLEMLIKWSEHSILSEEKEIVMKLIIFLINNIHNDRNEILKFNLNAFKTFIEIYKPYIEVPFELLIEKIKRTANVKSGIQIVGIFLANNIIPWTKSNVYTYWSNLIYLITDKNFESNINPTAEVIGMTLKVLQNEISWKKQLDEFENELSKILDKSTFNKLVQILEHIQIHYPAIINKYFKKIFNFSRDMKNLATTKLCLKNLLRLTDFNAKEFEFFEFPLLFESKDEDIHFLTLQLIEKIINSTKLKSLNVLVNESVKFKNNNNPNIREAVYNIFIAIYNNYDDELKDLARKILLNGLFDDDPNLQEKLQLFWCNRNSNNTLQTQFIKLLTEFYSAESEMNYLGYSIYFLLESCKTLPEYQENLFKHQLSECKYSQQHLNLSWHSQHNFLTPLFSNTFSSQKSEKFFGLRQTAPMNFSPTQSMTVSNSLESVSSFMFKTESILSNLFHNDRVETVDKKSNKIYVKHAPRFVKNIGDTKKYFAKIEVMKREKREEFRKNRIKQRDANVSIYRKYQKGDFPDIVIPASSVIQPLQILAKRDNNIARNLFVMLFNSLVDQLPNDVRNDFLKNIHKSITKIFEETTSYIPELIGTFFDILLKYNMYTNPELVFILSKNSGLLSNGALLLENQINLIDENSEAKKGCGNENSMDLHWVKLAEIYKELKLWDAVTGIFTNKLSIPNNLIINAIKNESDQLWQNASENYKSLLDTDNSIVRQNFYSDSFLRCVANLSQWEKISEYIATEVKLENIWDNDYNQEYILPWFFVAGMHETLEKETDTILLTSLRTWTKDDFKAKYIKENFSEVLSVLSLLQDDLKSSKYYLESFMLNFLEDWSNINPLNVELRCNKLSILHKIVEIEMYLNCVQNLNQNNCEEKLKSILSFWKKQSDLSSTLVMAETKSVYRTKIIEQLKNKIINFTDKNLDEFINKTKINFISYALQLNNYYVAHKYIRQSVDPDKEDIKLILCMCNCLLLRCERFDNEKKLNDLKKGIVKINKIFNENSLDTDLTLEGRNIMFKFSNKISQTLNDIDVLERTQFCEDISEDLRRTFSNSESFNEFSVDILEQGIKIGENTQSKNLINTYLTLILFLLQQNTEIYNEMIIKYILRCMKLNSLKAQQLFSHVLKILNKYYEHIFINESNTVPIWMFITWIPQLLSNMDTNLRTVSNILVKIAENYPQAIVYQYYLKKQKLIVNEKNEKIIKKLDEILLNPHLETFILALTSVHVPEKHLDYHKHKIMNDKKNLENFNIEFCQKIQNASKNLDSIFGPVFEPYKKICQIILEVLSRKNLSREEINNVFANTEMKLSQKFNHLKDYCPWLANFQGTRYEYCLEVPGQYKGDRKPLIQYHTQISCFKDEVQIFNTQRKPIKITIIGNDAKEYEFLVKLGEDLRQDQRIQQLCSLANNILQTDQKCSQRNLFIETYNVTPLTSNIGLIQFVSDTNMLGNVIFGALNNEQRKEFNQIFQDYQNWIRKASKYKTNDLQNNYFHYFNACTTYNRDETISKYREFVNRVPSDIIRRAFWKISKDLESFSSLRHQFITSYSTMCAIHWLLGIGDRHLSNTLIHEKTGRCIGIDFGCAFDTSIRNLPYPEIVPFRLTPHIINLMEPFNENGFIEWTMIHCLKAFKNEKDILLSSMDVFINEPTLSWLETAQNNTEGYILSDFIPREKLLNAKLKFCGCNPIKITIDELNKRYNEREEAYLDVIKDIVKGSVQFNIRCRLPMDNLSVEEQVKCLLDQATDYNILGRAYEGYQAWV